MDEGIQLLDPVYFFLIYLMGGWGWVELGTPEF